MIETSQTTNTYTFKIEPDDQGGRMRTVTIHRHNVLPVPVKGKGRGKKSLPKSHILIGFDTEYQTNEEIESRSSVEEGSRNELLSYQYCVKTITEDGQDDPGTEVTGIIIPEPDRRLLMEEFVRIAVGSLIETNPNIVLPTDVYLIGHFTRADLPAFSDFRNKARQLMSNVRSTFLTLEHYIPVDVSDDGGAFGEFQVRIRDTILLSPASAKSLADVGKIVGFNKIVLDPDPKKETKIKSHMADLRRDDWDLFRTYAIRDAEVCVRYAERIIRQHHSLFQKFQMPATLTGFGTKLVLNDWKRRGLSRYDVLGREELTDTRFNKKMGYFQRRKVTPFIEEIFHDISLVTEAYHGGRNEQFIFGVAEEGEWRDHDLSSAYPTAMTLIGIPDWKRCRIIDRFDNIDPLDLAYFSVDFEFPRSVRFPTLPVRTANGIVFPRKGHTKCAAPELDLAYRLGAKIRIRRAVHVPTDRNGSVFRDFIEMTIQERSLHTKGTFDNLFWKEVGNSTYGKTAQGLRQKRVYDLRSDDMADLPESEITQPFFAAFITSYTRAVLGEILNTFSPHVQVFSVTTDGFLSDASDLEIEKAMSGPLFQTFVEGKKRLRAKDEPLEIKHRVKQPVGWRTRGAATLKPGEGENGIVLQKGGLKTREHHSMEQENTHTIERFLTRTPESKVEYKSGVGLKDMIRMDTDFVFRSVTKYLSMEFDWKRRPINPREVAFEFNGGLHRHLTFDTEPVDDTAEFTKVRDAWESYAKKPRKNLKAVHELEQFLKYVETNVDQEKRVARYLRKEDGPIQRARQQLCQAFKKEQAGFDVIKGMRRITHDLFCNALIECGIPCKVTDVENGKKGAFEPHRTPRSPEVLQALSKLKRDYYPQLEIEVLLSEEPTQNPQQSDAKLAA